jgi:hypothetical protein
VDRVVWAAELLLLKKESEKHTQLKKGGKTEGGGRGAW